MTDSAPFGGGEAQPYETNSNAQIIGTTNILIDIAAVRYRRKKATKPR